MDRELFDVYINENAEKIKAISDAAKSLHESVNQTYDKTLPYSYHLSAVADAAIEYGNEVVTETADILPLIFGAYFHDSIEDARLTYNDVKKVASQFMDSDQVLTAAEIVYAVTNDKGRTRAERAGEHYYAGIRTTPFAPFIKLCDRYANIKHSVLNSNSHMSEVYHTEWCHFIESIDAHSSDSRFSLPKALINSIESLLKQAP